MLSGEPLIRLVVIGIFLALMPIGIYQRVRSESSGETLDRRQEGWFILISLRLLGFSCWLAVLLWMINPHWLAWLSVPLPMPVRWFGVFVVASGAALTGWTLRSLGRNLTDTVVTRQSHTLVFHGPYQWVRHPLYLAVLILTTGLSLATATPLFFVMGVAIFTLIAIRTNVEERNLVARFGAEYRAYMNRTGRFFPRLH